MQGVGAGAVLCGTMFGNHLKLNSPHMWLNELIYGHLFCFWIVFRGPWGSPVLKGGGVTTLLLCLLCRGRLEFGRLFGASACCFVCVSLQVGVLEAR